jgi:MoaA/NifB/PqqE/SkfB family radical SAM enzyme
MLRKRRRVNHLRGMFSYKSRWAVDELIPSEVTINAGAPTGRPGDAGMAEQMTRTGLRQFVLKPTVFCYHRCPYCDLRQDYYRAMVAGRKQSLQLAPPGNATVRQNPGHMPRDLALRLVDEAAALGMEELQLSGGDPLLYPHLTDVITAARRHPGVFVLMNSVG